VSNFLHHTSCDNCGSSDANGVFDDGHTYCWSCNKATYDNSNRNLEEVAALLQTKPAVRDNSLPEDFTYTIPKEPYGWLKQYSLTNEEIINNKLGWSASRQLLIFPYYKCNENYGDINDNDAQTSGTTDEQDKDGTKETTILFWQGRYFPQRKPKSYSCGNINDNIIINSYTGNIVDAFRDCLVVVEDPVSAIKVSRVVDTLPLFGSHLSLQKAIRISKFYEHVVLWLDNDKTKDMINMQQRYKYLFKKVSVISTELDPKEYNTEKIKELLNGTL
jgi:hypothetical protein